LPIRDRSGRLRFRETPESVREVNNLGWRMLLVHFGDRPAILLFAGPDYIGATKRSSKTGRNGVANHASMPLRKAEAEERRDAPLLRLCLFVLLLRLEI